MTSGLQELEIHWLSIMNSFILVLLLTGFVAVIIMRILKRDFSRYARTEGDDGMPLPVPFTCVYC
jgi:hypothetical protein